MLMLPVVLLLYQFNLSAQFIAQTDKIVDSFSLTQTPCTHVQAFEILGLKDDVHTIQAVDARYHSFLMDCIKLWYVVNDHTLVLVKLSSGTQRMMQVYSCLYSS